ncbi:MAG: helix-turn-helix transcriptional regulator [Oscillospiraceae bacterium]|nr:helix-turn-helix transcriptional regulator [Oscillospiraceae bacterium]
MFYERLKELRLSLYLNQVQLAKKLNVSKQSVSNWESGYIQPPIDMVIKICQIFHVSADYLLGLDDRRSLDVSGLTAEQITHLQAIVDDLRA